MENELERVDKFVRAGKVNAKDNFGYTALHYAARAGHMDVCRLLLRGGAEVESGTKSGAVTPLQRAALRGKVDVVQLLVEQGRANVRTEDADGKTALHRAVEGGHLDVVMYLMGRDGTLKDVKDNHGETPVDVARERRKEKILEVFLGERGEGDGEE